MFCKHCGNSVADEAKFCEKCGNKAGDGSGHGAFLPATILRRFSNLILDSIFKTLAGFVILSFVSLVIFIVSGKSDGNMWWWTSILPTFISIIISFLYYLIMEFVWQRSLGKYITKTKVVMRDGRKPPLKNIIGRTFARYIPFEALSFLFGSNPVGWHDRLSGTIVVPAEYTEEDVKKIDFDALKKANKSNTVGIVIAIVIAGIVMVAVIGILSSVVLVSLSTARQKGLDAKAGENMYGIATGLVEYYGKHNNKLPQAKTCYVEPFTDGSIAQKVSDLQDRDLKCFSDDQTFAISMNMKSVEQTVCVDTSGYGGPGIAILDQSGAHCEVLSGVNSK